MTGLDMAISQISARKYPKLCQVLIEYKKASETLYSPTKSKVAKILNQISVIEMYRRAKDLDGETRSILNDLSFELCDKTNTYFYMWGELMVENG